MQQGTCWPTEGSSNFCLKLRLQGRPSSSSTGRLDCLSTVISDWAILKRKFAHITIYLVCCVDASEVQDRVVPTTREDGSWSVWGARAWTVLSVDRLLEVWKGVVSDLHHEYFLAQIETALMARRGLQNSWLNLPPRRMRNYPKNWLHMIAETITCPGRALNSVVRRGPTTFKIFYRVALRVLFFSDYSVHSLS